VWNSLELIFAAFIGSKDYRPHPASVTHLCRRDTKKPKSDLPNDGPATSVETLEAAGGGRVIGDLDRSPHGGFAQIASRGLNE
jgi:hypothetical protein